MLMDSSLSFLSPTLYPSFLPNGLTWGLISSTIICKTTVLQRLFNSYPKPNSCNKCFLLLQLNPNEYNSIGICLISYETAKLFPEMVVLILHQQSKRVPVASHPHQYKNQQFCKNMTLCKPKQGNGPSLFSLCSEPCPCGRNFAISRSQMHIFFILTNPVLALVMQICLQRILNYECMRFFTFTLLLLITEGQKQL